VNYQDWIEDVPRQFKDDPLWDIEVYRKALFFADIAWEDCEAMLAKNLGKPVA
jgi:hypothetical protein